MSKARKGSSKANRYRQIIERIFWERYQEGAHEVAFQRDDFVRHAKLLRIKLPKNLGDIPIFPRPVTEQTRPRPVSIEDVLSTMNPCRL